MPEISADSRQFLQHAGWSSAKITPLAGDASKRRYYRLSDGPVPWGRAILMDAAQLPNTVTKSFAALSTWLCTRGFSAPAIIFADAENGRLIVEDLGDEVFLTLCEKQPRMQVELYSAATAVLHQLHRQTPPQELLHGTVLAKQTAAHLASQAQIFFEYFAPEPGNSEHARMFQHHLAASLELLNLGDRVVVLRDFHAENLVWLRNRSDAARVGLLDFQDALIGHPAYDLVSLLQDARRDIDREFEAQILATYPTSAASRSQFLADYAALGAQRQLRILGIFAQLATLHGKHQYLAYVPRVWAYLRRNLEHPALSGLRHYLQNTFPEPSRESLWAKFCQ